MHEEDEGEFVSDLNSMSQNHKNIRICESDKCPCRPRSADHPCLHQALVPAVSLLQLRQLLLIHRRRPLALSRQLLLIHRRRPLALSRQLLLIHRRRPLALSRPQMPGRLLALRRLRPQMRGRPLAPRRLRPRLLCWSLAPRRLRPHLPCRSQMEVAQLRLLRRSKLRRQGFRVVKLGQQVSLES